MRIIFSVLILFCVVLACQNENGQAENDDTNQETTDSTAVTTTEEITNANFQAIELTPEVMWIKDNKITLTNQEYIELPGQGSDTTTLFLVRSGQREENKTSLALMGRMQASRLANVMKDAELKTIYWSNNSEMQTGFHTATANESELLNYNGEDLQSLIGIILKNDIGKRVAIIGNMISVPEVINRIKGSAIPALGIDDYDDLYIAILKGEEIIDVYHSKMYRLQ